MAFLPQRLVNHGDELHHSPVVTFPKASRLGTFTSPGRRFPNLPTNPSADGGGAGRRLRAWRMLPEENRRGGVANHQDQPDASSYSDQGTGLLADVVTVHQPERRL